MNTVKKISALLLALLLCLPLAACSSQKKIMSFRDSSITANMYSFWLSSFKTKFVNTYNNSADTDAFWDTEVMNGVTTEQYAREQIDNEIRKILIGIQLYREYGLKLDADIVSAIDADIAEKIDYYGSRASLNETLSAFGINADILRDIYIAEEKLYAVYDYLYGENGVEKVTDAEIDAYYRANYSRVKYLIIYTEQEYVLDDEGFVMTDADGYYVTRDLTDEEKAAKQDKIRDAMICVNAGDDFDSIMTQYNEVDMSYYTNGFYISANELGTFGYQMVKETAEMDVGEIRRIDDNGITMIVQKLELLDRSDFSDADTEQLASLEEYCVGKKYTDRFSALFDEVVCDQEQLDQFSLRTAAINASF